MWLPLPEILLFHLEEACTPFKAYFTSFVSDVSLNFLLPTMEDFITHPWCPYSILFIPLWSLKCKY